MQGVFRLILDYQFFYGLRDRTNKIKYPGSV